MAASRRAMATAGHRPSSKTCALAPLTGPSSEPHEPDRLSTPAASSKPHELSPSPRRAAHSQSTAGLFSQQMSFPSSRPRTSRRSLLYPLQLPLSRVPLQIGCRNFRLICFDSRQQRRREMRSAGLRPSSCRSPTGAATVAPRGRSPHGSAAPPLQNATPAGIAKSLIPVPFVACSTSNESLAHRALKGLG